ncbi:NLR family CARD domain-containing protein 3-like [Dicentrarchus labrax]|uniref:NLR family CARD domain-containing protein 3-like n=1 Tax=Dicentrarchus labrax TaxID=13489 RepID=UPI0021F60E9B|nr:NLR family CARD domain-containing protein 3-like [Dicentrarchus labrax]
MRSDRSKNEPTNFNEGELRPPQSQRTVSTSVEPDQLEDGGDASKDKDVRDELTAALKNRILSHYEDKLRKHETDTELYGTEEKNNKAQTYDAIFQKSKKEEVRTVLMKGIAAVGKTFQTRRFMVDWAKGKTNNNIDLIVPFHFSELHTRRDKVQSLKDLLNSVDDKHRSFFMYNECKVVFVLDGLEECELPLDFENNKELTDMEESASMDVLLTSLIKGKLLPSAHLWIISQPSGVDKIPPEYIQKVTECRETSKRRQKLISRLKEILRKENTQDEEINHPNQKNTEHIIREDRRSEVDDEARNGRTVKPVNQVSDIFKAAKGQTMRTVLTVGEPDIGKTFHVQKF